MVLACLNGVLIMEMRCTQCGHIGQAASVVPRAQGLGLICANCQHENVLDFGGADTTPNEDAQPTAPATPAAPVLKSAPFYPALSKPEDTAITDAMLQKLVPPPGEGLRCRKCLNLITADDVNCGRCGLNLEEALRYKEGQAPWERPPTGKSDAWDQASLLWESIQETWQPDRVADYTEFIKDEGLHDLGIRHLRYRLIDHPNDQLALDAMADIAKVMQARIVIARHQATQDKQEFAQEVSKIRGFLMISSLVFWIAIFALFAGLFLKNCG